MGRNSRYPSGCNVRHKLEFRKLVKSSGSQFLPAPPTPTLLSLTSKETPSRTVFKLGDVFTLCGDGRHCAQSSIFTLLSYRTSLGDKRGSCGGRGGHTFEVSEWRSYHTLLLKIRLHPLQLCKKVFLLKTVYPHPYWPYRYHPTQRWTLDLHRNGLRAYTIPRLPNCSSQCVIGNVLCLLREGGHYV